VINFLYCFDENYNFQAFSSIISLLDCVDEKINIFVIHRIEKDKNFFPSKILNHKNLNTLLIKKFDKKIKNYPNLFDAHVSEATYYRLFCSDYLPEIETIFYIDADIICVSNPITLIKEDTKNLLNSNFIISSKTELTRSELNIEVFDRLELNGDNYFNAGVMNINLTKWKNLDYDYENLLKKMSHKLNYWDQDLLNYLFDSKYSELDQRLNTVVDFSYYEYLKNVPSIDSVIEGKNFIHFAGSHKPWSVNGIMVQLSEIYQKEFRKISKNHYHIVHKIRSYSIYIFFNNIKNLKFFKIKHKIRFLIELTKSLLEINIKINES
tara:strand:- start:856 stop:1824 length:969 start_codon:yes stop_codon:yes gene_type:complete